MKKVIFVLALIASISAKSAVNPVNFWYLSDTVFQVGQTGYMAVNFYRPAIQNYTATDTLAISVVSYEPNSGPGPRIFAMSMHDIDTLPVRADGSTWLYFTIPSNFISGRARIICGRAITQKQVTITPYAPVITSGLNATGMMGQSFSYLITADNDPETYNATGLPAGLEMSSIGEILGSPTQSGTFQVQITATNITGSDTETLTLTISQASTPTSVLSPTDPEQKKGTVYYYTSAGVYVATENTGEPTSLSGEYVFRILYTDKTTACGHVYYQW